MSETDGDRLRDERERLGLSQRAMAELGGVTKNTHLAYEKGTSPLPLDYLRRLVPHGVDLRYVATGTRGADGAAASHKSDEREEQTAPDHLQLITMQVALPSEAALARMFEGLLRPLDRDMPVDELARTLARRLPTGLAQLQYLRDARGRGVAPEDDEAPRAPARSDLASPPARRT